MSTAFKSVKGLKNVVIAQLASDTVDGTTYGAIERVIGAKDLALAPQGADPDIQYADDDEFDVLYPDPELMATLEVTRLPLVIQKELYGHTIDANGVIVKKSTDEPPYFALGFEAATRSGTSIYVWLLKGRAKPLSGQFHSMEGSKVTRQTHKIEFTFIRRISDNAYEYDAEDNKNGFTGGATYLDTVYASTAASVTELAAVTWAIDAPAKAGTPDTTMSGTGYTTAVTWTPDDDEFAGSTVYSVEVIITAGSGYVFSPSFSASSIASLPSGAVVVRDGDKQITVNHTYAATSA